MTPDYQLLWDTAVVDPIHVAEARTIALHITSNQERYLQVGVTVCPTAPVPWSFIGIIHYLECSMNFHTHLYNGDPLTQRTVRYPRGKPIAGTPPFTWEASAADALTSMGYQRPLGWTIPVALAKLEDYNGHGYQKKGINTPYLWARTNHYTSGKFTEVLNPQTHLYDVHYDPNLVSAEMGAVTILKYLAL